MKTAVAKNDNGKSFSVRPYRSGDEAEILRVFENVFDVKRSAEHWRWQFGENPYGKASASLACDSKTGEIIGHIGVKPVPLNMMGRPVLAFQSLDAMVHPDYRMLGVFEQLAEHSFEQLSAAGHVLVYGFPNRNSYPGFMRKLKWKRVVFVSSYARRLTLRHALRKLLPVPGLAPLVDIICRAGIRLQCMAGNWYLRKTTREPLELRVSDTVPAGYDELWNASCSYEVLSLWKDEKYFAWRYDRYPVHKFRYYVLASGERIDAMAVISAASGVFEIHELVVRDHDVRRAKRLVNILCIEALRSRSDRLAFSGSDLHFFDEVFSGFRREILFNHVFCLRVLADDDSLSSNAPFAENWSVTSGDGDLI